MVVEAHGVALAYGLHHRGEVLARRRDVLEHDSVGDILRVLEHAGGYGGVQQPVGQGLAFAALHIVFVGGGIAAYADGEELLDGLAVVEECAPWNLKFALGVGCAAPEVVEFAARYASVAADCVDNPDVAVEEVFSHCLMVGGRCV